MRVQDWLLPTATGAVGLVVGFLIARQIDVPEAAAGGEPAAVFTPSPTGAARPSREISLDDLRRVVREELAARDAGSPARSVVAAAEPAAASPPTPEQTAAAANAQRVLDAAIARRLWTDSDADQLRAHFYSLSPDQQDEILRNFSVAVNQGRLVPETDKIPF
jgi:hypothetical protein